MSNTPSRRKFLGATAATAAAGWATTYAASAKAASGPNETINLGLIGCGGRGQ